MENDDSQRRAGDSHPFLALAAILTIVFAAVSQAGAQDNGQPTRAIRLSYVDGDVQLVRGGQITAQQAVANTPLLQGMSVSTSDNGRAEIQFEDGSVARLSPNSSLTLQVLSGEGSSGDAEMVLDRGLAYFELQGNGQSGQMAVHFGDSTATVSGFTVLRVHDDTPPGDLAVFAGNAHLDRGGALSLDLHGGESVTLAAANPGSYNLSESIEPDSWDSWNADRDQALTAEAQQNTAPPEIGADNSNPAWNDLDSSGAWYNVPDQGYVWSPYDAANASFDPYGNGNWVWTPGFGYTWASAYSWGYLPYQCGAWNYYNSFGWGWAPGFGGCTPWWNTGFYGGPIIGAHPSWYRPVRRPIAPRRPVRGRPVPLIAVNRPGFAHPGFAGTTALPVRNASTPVSINGHTIVARHPMPADSFFDRPAFTSQAVNPVALPTHSLPGRAAYTPVRPGYASSSQPAIGNRFPTPGNGFAAQSGRTYGPPGGMNIPRTASAQPHVYTPPSRPASGGFPSGNPGGYHGGGGFHGGFAGGYHGGGAPSGGGGGGGHH